MIDYLAYYQYPAQKVSVKDKEKNTQIRIDVISYIYDIGNVSSSRKKSELSKR